MGLQALVGNRTGMAMESRIAELEHFLSHQARARARAPVQTANRGAGVTGAVERREGECSRWGLSASGRTRKCANRCVGSSRTARPRPRQAMGSGT